jgi:hypothetical protein
VQQQASVAFQKQGAAAAVLASTPIDPTAGRAAAGDLLKRNMSSLHLLPHPLPPGRAIPLHIVLLWRLPLCVAAVAVASLIMRTARRVSGSGKSSGGRLSKPRSHVRLGVGRLQ